MESLRILKSGVSSKIDKEVEIEESGSSLELQSWLSINLDKKDIKKIDSRLLSWSLEFKLAEIDSEVVEYLLKNPAYPEKFEYRIDNYPDTIYNESDFDDSPRKAMDLSASNADEICQNYTKKTKDDKLEKMIEAMKIYQSSMNRNFKNSSNYCLRPNLEIGSRPKHLLVTNSAGVYIKQTLHPISMNKFMEPSELGVEKNRSVITEEMMIEILLASKFKTYSQQTIVSNNAETTSISYENIRDKVPNLMSSARKMDTDQEMIAILENDSSGINYCDDVLGLKKKEKKNPQHLPLASVQTRVNEKAPGDLFNILGKILNFGSRK